MISDIFKDIYLEILVHGAHLCAKDNIASIYYSDVNMCYKLIGILSQDVIYLRYGIFKER